MTTITVVKKNGLAAIAADTLTKYGYVKESAEYVVNHEKIIKVGDGYIAVAGSATADLAMRIFFSKRGARVRLNTIADVFKTWNELHRVLKDEFFLNADDGDDNSFESSKANALIVNTHGIFGVSSFRCVQEFTRFYAYGSGSDFARGAMYAAYDDEGASAEEVARLGVRAATEFDEDSGLPINCYTVKLRKK